jgi:hypothetical protein
MSTGWPWGRFAIAGDDAVIRGGDYYARFLVEDDNGAPVDLTGATPVMQVRTAPDRPSVIVEANPTNGRLTLSGSELILDLPASLTTTLPVGKYQYEIELRYSGGRVTPLLAGPFEVLADVAVLPP